LSRRLSHWDEWTLPHLMIPDLMQPLVFSVDTSKTVSIKVADLTQLKMIRPTREQFEKELPDVLADADLREDRASEILAQIDDIISFISAVLPQSLDRMPSTRLLLQTANRLVITTELRLKHEFACARPCEYSPQVQPIIRSPGHGTYPMGHGCEAFMHAYLLGKLTRDSGDRDCAAWKSLSSQLKAIAWRIGENRVIAGVHFPIDLYAGKALAQWLVDYLEYCALGIDDDKCYPLGEKNDKQELAYRSFTFDPSKVNENSHQESKLLQVSDTTGGKGSPSSLPKNLIWRKVWKAARLEWRWMNAERFV
jgi:hypothetical protein